VSEVEREAVDTAIRIVIFAFWGGLLGGLGVLVYHWWTMRRWRR
jgi:hypothetical protein